MSRINPRDGAWLMPAPRAERCADVSRPTRAAPPRGRRRGQRRSPSPRGAEHERPGRSQPGGRGDGRPTEPAAADSPDAERRCCPRPCPRSARPASVLSRSYRRRGPGARSESAEPSDVRRAGQPRSRPSAGAGSGWEAWRRRSRSQLDRRGACGACASAVRPTVPGAPCDGARSRCCGRRGYACAAGIHGS